MYRRRTKRSGGKRRYSKRTQKRSRRSTGRYYISRGGIRL